MGIFSVMGPFSLQHGIGPAVPNNFFGAFRAMGRRGELTVPILVGEETFNPQIVREPLTVVNARQFMNSAQSALSDFPYPHFDDEHAIPLAATGDQWEIVEYDPAAVGPPTRGSFMVRRRQTGAVISFDTMADVCWQLALGMEWMRAGGEGESPIIRLMRTVVVLPDEVGTTGIDMVVAANHVPTLFGLSDRQTPLEIGLALCTAYLESRAAAVSFVEGEWISTSDASTGNVPAIPVVKDRRGLRIASDRPMATQDGILQVVLGSRSAQERCHLVIEAEGNEPHYTLSLSAPMGLTDREMANSVMARWWASGVRCIHSGKCYD